MRIALLRDVYGVEHDDPRVVKSALAIIELGKELMVNFGHINWYVCIISIHSGRFHRHPALSQSKLGS